MVQVITCNVLNMHQGSVTCMANTTSQILRINRTELPFTTTVSALIQHSVIHVLWTSALKGSHWSNGQKTWLYTQYGNTPIVFVHLYALHISLLIIICGHFQRTVEYTLDTYCKENVCLRNYLSSIQVSKWIFFFVISIVLLLSFSKIHVHVSFLMINSWATIKDVNLESFNIDVL